MHLGDGRYSSPGLAQWNGSSTTAHDANETTAEAAYREEHLGWQVRVLSHLKQVAARGTLGHGSIAPVKGAANDRGPEFLEHLELAEHMLKRITGAVGVLQDPEKNERPIVLREYTEKMVLQVCKDLRQWLEQLSVLISLYHVHLLDLENERCRLAELLQKREDVFKQNEHKCKEAVMRHDRLQERWKEDKNEAKS